MNVNASSPAALSLWPTKQEEEETGHFLIQIWARVSISTPKHQRNSVCGAWALEQIPLHLRQNHFSSIYITSQEHLYNFSWILLLLCARATGSISHIRPSTDRPYIYSTLCSVYTYVWVREWMMVSSRIGHIIKFVGNTDTTRAKSITLGIFNTQYFFCFHIFFHIWISLLVVVVGYCWPGCRFGAVCET